MMRNEMEQEYGNDEVLGNTCRQRRRQCGGRLQNGNATRRVSVIWRPHVQTAG